MKKDFYIRSRDPKEGFIWKKQSGEVLQNEFGLRLCVYHSNEPCDESKEKPMWWFVVEESTGLSMARGRTKKNAVSTAFSLSAQTIGNVKSAILKHVQKNGYPPDYIPIPGYDIMDGFENPAFYHHAETIEDARQWCEEHIGTYPIMVIYQQTEDGQLLFVDVYRRE